ncbi:MAG: zinc ribbon domain-containing protein [Candidatus Odinarchaeota archaeon]
MKREREPVVTAEPDYLCIADHLPDKARKLWNITTEKTLHIYRLDGDLRLSPDQPDKTDTGAFFEVKVDIDGIFTVPSAIHAPLDITADMFFKFSKITSNEAIIYRKKQLTMPKKPKAKKKREKESPKPEDCIKTRIFLLELLKKASYTTLTPVFRQAVETARAKCRADFKYCYQWLKADRKEKDYFSLFNTINVVLPVITRSNRKDFTEACLQVHDSAVEAVFDATYPSEYLELVKRVQDVLDKLSTVNPAAFKKTSKVHIKDQVINCNGPVLASLKRIRTQSGEPDALWQLFTAFTSDNSGNQEDNATAKFITRAFWPPIHDLYYNYREKIIRDTSIQLLASYLSKEELVTDQELLHFFREERLSHKLAWKLYQTDSDHDPCLARDLNKHFSGWGAVPSWNYYLNELRQVRNITCEALDDRQLLAAFQHLQAPATVNHFKREVIKSFKDHISSLQGNRENQTLEEYFANNLVTYKLKRPLRKLFIQTWDGYIKGKQKASTKATPRSLTGLKAFIYNFTVEYFEKNRLTTGKYTELTAKEAWRTISKAMKQRLEETRSIFEQVLPGNTGESREVLDQLAEQGVKQFLARTCQGKTSTGQLHFPHKRKVFHAFHRATPLKVFDLPASGVIHPSRLQPCLEEFILSRFARRAEELIRPALVGLLRQTLRQTLATPSHYINKPPVVKNPGISLGYADEQLYRLDLEEKTFQLALAKTPDMATWFDFTIQDRDDRLQPFFKMTTIDGKEARQWKALSPQITSRRGKLALHVPFKSLVLPAIREITLNEPVEEILTGNDLGLNTYDYLSVIWSVSIYRQAKDSNGKDIIVRDILDWKPLAHYSIDDLEALHKEFDMTTGTFKNLQVARDAKGKPIKDKNGDPVYLRRRRNGNRRKERGRTTWGKGHLREVFAEIRKTQAEINRLLEDFPDTYKTVPRYWKLTEKLSDLWDEHGRVLKAVVTGVAAKVRDIVLFWLSKYPHLPVRVQVEDLSWSQHSRRSEAGYYLAHNQKNFFHSQVQQTIAHLLREHGIGVWKVDARNTSQACAICGHLEEGQRHGKTFRCKNENHKNAKGNPYSTNADLNAGRNVAKSPPLTLAPIIP